MDALMQTGVGGEEVHEALANRERRDVVSILQDAGEPLALADIAVELAEREGLAGGEKWDRAHQIRIELHHCHLPKLEKTGVVAHDRERAVAWATSD